MATKKILHHNAIHFNDSSVVDTIFTLKFLQTN